MTLLLRLGADSNIEGRGRTPLYCVANECPSVTGPEVIRALVRAGADVNACSGVTRANCFPAAGCWDAALLDVAIPYIANTAGWITAELGRQPWLVFGLMRTADGYSKTVSAGNGMFTLLGFMGMYTVLGLLFLFLVGREVEQGPEGAAASQP